MQGKMHEVEAVGMDSLLTFTPAQEAKELAIQFQSADHNGKEGFNRPCKKVQLMLGMTSRSLHCTDSMEAGGLHMSRSGFYPGWVLTGCAESPATQDHGDKSSTSSTQNKETSTRSHPK